MWSSLHFALTHKTSQPTKAIQLDIHAVSQTKKATDNEGVLISKNFEASNQDKLKRRYSANIRNIAKIISTYTFKSFVIQSGFCFSHME